MILAEVPKNETVKIKNRIKSELKNLKFSTFLLLTLAGTINAFGVTIFLFPVKLYDSGISGLSMLLDQVTPGYLTLSVFLLVLNIPIFVFGLKKQGVTFRHTPFSLLRSIPLCHF